MVGNHTTTPPQPTLAEGTYIDGPTLISTGDTMDNDMFRRYTQQTQAEF